MKKIVFENTYKCVWCQRNFYGHINKCPICKQKGKKLSDNEIVAFTKTQHCHNCPKGPKGPQGVSLNDYNRPKNT